jgi:hypothetical protein
MSNGDWEDLREEVCTYLELGLSKGETELDTMTVWFGWSGRSMSICVSLWKRF